MTTRFHKSSRRAMTMVEVMISLVIIGFLSTAIGTLVSSTMGANTFLQTQIDSQSEVDIAIRRIMYNLRTAAAIPTWSSTGIQTLTIQKTGVGTITYYVDGNNNLLESDPRYNVGSTPNILIHNIAAVGFVCTITAPSATQLNTLVKVDIAVATNQKIERHVTVAVRGF